MKTQPRLKRGKRERYQTYLNKELREAIKRDMIRWDSSESWIVATALAAFYDVDIIKPSDLKLIKKRRKAA